MRLRSITLTNVRRFTDTARIEGLSDGLNVLCKPNEFGKSTLFDALQAVFFKAHTSSNKDVKALRPHAGGAPEVVVEVETDDGLFVITKRWMSKPAAKIEQDGRLIAQADEAESWIGRLLGGGDGGPSGLLWVRQGLTTLSEGSKKEKEAALEARRDLLSSVTGEVEAMTGGRRMDLALSRCKEELSNFATVGGRPKTGGPWKDAEQHVESLRLQHTELTHQVTQLRDQLDERKRKRRELEELENPEASAARKKRVADATAELQAAQRHAEAVESEARKVDAARLSVTNVKSRLEGLRRDLKERNASAEARQAVAENAEDARLALKAAEVSHSKAQQECDEAHKEYQSAQEALRASQRRQAALDGAERRKELKDRIEKAETARISKETAAAEAAQGPDPRAMRELEELAATLKTTQAIRDSKSASLLMNYAEGGQGKIRQNDQELPDGIPVPITGDTDLVIEQIGTLSIHTGIGDDKDDSIETAENALIEELQRFNCTTIDEARDAAFQREAAEQRRLEAKATFESHAPNGIEYLRKKLTAIPELDAAESDVPTLDEAEARFAEAEEDRLTADTARTVATERFSDARSESSKLDSALEAAQTREARALTALEQHGDTDETRLEHELSRAVTALEAAEALHSEKAKLAPDVHAAEATLKRVQSVEDAARSEIARLKPALAALEANISRTADEAVEERLVETKQQLELAEAKLAGIEKEVAVLQKLQSVLEDARSEARDRYFEPVANELKPLLQLLWPDAELSWGDQTLLPLSLIRNGQEEPIDILSGGTKEQISLLVRLAFARMLAKQGQSAPIILDDALVFTDDDRIELMFDALHRQAGDLQILVLSCRQRAFRDLGGNTLHLN